MGISRTHIAAENRLGLLIPPAREPCSNAGPSCREREEHEQVEKQPLLIVVLRTADPGQSGRRWVHMGRDIGAYSGQNESSQAA